MILTAEQKKIIRKEENEFPERFANYRETEYGILFYNEDNKNSYDSNHAVIYPDRIDSITDVLKDIAALYTAKKIAPAIYHPFVKDYFEDNKGIFAEHRFKIKFEECRRIFLLCEESRIVPDDSIDVRRLTVWDKRIAQDILIPNGEDYEIPVHETAIKLQGNYLFAGYKGIKRLPMPDSTFQPSDAPALIMWIQQRMNAVKAMPGNFHTE